MQDIGGDHQRIHDQKTKYSAITFKHTLLPVWIAVFRYHDEVYQILVNGRTGKISGRRPWSAWKICGRFSRSCWRSCWSFSRQRACIG